MSDLLITGGAGFIGAHFIAHVNKELYDHIIIVDKLTYAADYAKILKHIKHPFYFYKADISKMEDMHIIYEQYNIKDVVNFAAESHVDKSIKDATAFITTNVIGVQVLMDLYLQHKCGGKFIHISTDEVYGPGLTIEADTCDEKAPLNPMNPYAATKASADLLLKSYINTYNFPGIICRLTNNFGTHQNKEKFIPKVIDCIKNDLDIPLYGDGLYYRNWLFVEDTCKMLNAVLEYGKVQEIYNMSGAGLVSNKALVHMLVELIEKNTQKKYKGRILHVKNRPGHDLCYLVDDSKMNSIVSFKKTSIKVGLKKIISE